MYIFPLIVAAYTIGELLGYDCVYTLLDVSSEASCYLWIILIWFFLK